VNAFFTQEARLMPAADTLLALGADFIMTGLRVTARPRVAGFNGPGDVFVEEASAGVAGEFAWVELSYRFAGRTPDLAERARATVILEKQRAGWRIRHVHSSMVERW
jgi:ketosteroid isomerase-like protein